MPPYVNTNCSHKECEKPNRFDLAELRKKDGDFVKGVVIRSDQMAGSEDQTEEFEVTCQHCGRKFKIYVKGG